MRPESKRPAPRHWPILLVLTAWAACTEAPAPTEAESPGTVAAALDTPTLFTDVALVGTAPCSSDYSRIDNCYNEANPQRPSIFRELSPAWRPYQPSGQTPTLLPSTLVGKVQPYPPFEYFWDGPRIPSTADADGAQQVLPFTRSTNDGRLSLRGGCRGCGESSMLVTFRPEVLGQDLEYDFAAKGALFSQPTHQPGSHPFIYYNPLFSSLQTRNNGFFPDALHSTLCEDSAPAYVSSKHNPLKCQARYEAGSPLVTGDCYDISLLYGLTAAENGNQWELRSVDVTVFVRDPKTLSAGERQGWDPGGWGLWIYPRNPEGEVKSLPQWELPPFRPFNVHETPWGDLDGNNSTWTLSGTNQINWAKVLSSHPGFKCYDQVLVGYSSGKPIYTYPRATGPSIPKWCQFFDRQSSRSRFQVEDDEDSVISNGGYWNGVHTRPASGEGKPLFLFEPTVSGDGRLLVVNMDGLFYSYSPNACRADGWAHMKPISMMPMDPQVNGRYEIAKSQVIGGVPQPFRDSMGNAIPFGVRNQGAYAWLDREGKNLFFAAKNNPHDGYYARQMVLREQFGPNVTTQSLSAPPQNDGERAAFNPDRAPAQAISVLGAWTHGKAVILDNGLSIADLGGNRADNLTRTFGLRLYAGDDLSLTPQGSSSIFSFENQLNHFDALRPTLPFDVVWNVQSNTQRTSEVAFDEYLNKQAFVVAHMNAPMRMDVSPFGSQRAETFPKDGFIPTRNAWAYVRGGEIADFRFARNPLVQNAATTSAAHGTENLQGPGSLRLRGGARVEPVALGGVSGKGVWLDGVNDFMDMGYPVQPSRRDWYLGIWLDSRQAFPTKVIFSITRTLPRTLFYFPDNSWIGLVAARDITGATWHELEVYNGATGGRYTVNLGSLVQPGRFFHLGVKVFTRAGQRTLQFLVNGTPVTTLAVAPTDTGFNLMADTVNGWTWMTVGDPGPSFVQGQSRLPFLGWVDEFRVYSLSAQDTQAAWLDEHICNNALGTLVDITSYTGESSHPALTVLRSRASLYPGAPTLLCEQMRLESYVDPRDYPAQYGEHLCIDRVHKNPHANPSLASRCKRAQKLALPVFQANAPRPDTSSNTFCLTCHTSTAPLPGLRPGALTAGSGPRYQDPRRQPMNVPAVMGGVVPPWLQGGVNLSDGTRTLDHHFDHYLAP
ncbi:MAG TPA: hypothetical protein VFZ09_26185 [Archangium sp.]|uniref:hypothetical protein n=1 Tax=Archangium sp. TaxID=1872627 RepID=UPI002E37CD75|nr:hypothetical protein [Archangium sp.]HEX5749748.1 hypothetical protein [Archangium sp.]